jgi:RNA polymerase sigma-70 factor (ECF subfamily)
VEPEQPDAQLIAASVADATVFAAVFDRHFARVHRYLARRVGPTLADDLTAETFITAFRARDRFDPEALDARPWLFGIAANLLRRHWRAERRQLRAYARTGVDPCGDPLADAERRVDAVSAGPALAGALASLPRADREALLLYAWAELSYEEIASALGIPVGTVRSRLSRARRRMAAALDPEPSRPDRRTAVQSATEGGHHG